jgi:hypothetical protein
MKMRPIVILVAYLFVASPNAFSQQQDGRVPEAVQGLVDGERLHKISEALGEIEKDLLVYQKAGGPSSTERTGLDGMLAAASSTQAYISTVSSALFISGLVTGSEEKRVAQQYVDLQLQGYSKLIDLGLESVNSSLLWSKSETIVAEGNRLKVEMRKTKDFFESVRNRNLDPNDSYKLPAVPHPSI